MINLVTYVCVNELLDNDTLETFHEDVLKNASYITNVDGTIWIEGVDCLYIVDNDEVRVLVAE